MDILKIINEIQEQAEKDHEELRPLGHSSYGLGVEWGTIETCKLIKERLKE